MEGGLRRGFIVLENYIESGGQKQDLYYASIKGLRDYARGSPYINLIIDLLSCFCTYSRIIKPTGVLNDIIRQSINHYLHLYFCWSFIRWYFFRWHYDFWC